MDGFPIDIREHDGLRTLRFATDRVQGAMRIADPGALVLEYTRAMMAALLLRDTAPARTLLIGLGAGSQTRFLHRHFPQMQLTAVEIEPAVLMVAREHFAVPDDDARLEVLIGDGFDYVQTTDSKFDLILVDGFNQHAHPGDLNTHAFYAACRTRLSEHGLLAVNLIGLSRNYRGGFVPIAAAFAQRAILLPRCASGNTIALAACGADINLSQAELRRRAQSLAARTGLDLHALLEAEEGGDGWRI